ncbi:MAG: histidine phosphatase family protein [Verrucomicrobiales bacterium]
MSPSEFTTPLAVTLNKKWFVLRHGRSEANESGIIASRLANAENAFGLTEVGRAEVAASVRAEAVKLLEEPPLILLASPFLRTRQTAEIAGEFLGLAPEIDPRLCERDFGEFELMSDEHYQEVWTADPETPTAVPGRAETVYEVVERAADLVLEVEKIPGIKTCLLVTHCDVAMILSCAFQNVDPRHHRTLDPIKTGEVRRLTQELSNAVSD